MKKIAYNNTFSEGKQILQFFTVNTCHEDRLTNKYWLYFCDKITDMTTLKIF